MKSLVRIVVAVMAVIALLLAPWEGIFLLLFGWFVFLWRVTQELTVDWLNVGFALSAFVVFNIGCHWFFSWLCSARQRATSIDDKVSQHRTWRWTWTLSGTTLTILLFAAGIAMVGIVHQVRWAMQDDEWFFKAPTVVRRMQSSNNLKQMGLAAHEFQQNVGTLPSGSLVDQAGLPLHSWQTQLLPNVEQSVLYDRIDLSRPWNDARNREHFAHELKVYRNPGLPGHRRHEDGQPALSDYSANRHVFSGGTTRALTDITDGLSQTLWFGEIKDQMKPWGYPVNSRDPQLGINKSPNGFGGPFPGGCQFTFADGSVRFLSDSIDPEVLNALATPAGAEPIADDY